MRTALLLSLCLLPAAARAQTSSPSSPAASQAAAPVEAIPFEEAVRRAAERSTPAGIAAQEIARVEALLWETRSASLPLIAANGTYTRIDHERDAPALIPVGPPGYVRSIEVRAVPVESNNVNLSASVPLLAPSRWYQWAHASDQVNVARASQADVRRLVTLTAARSYLTIIAQKRAIEVSQRAVETAATHYDYAHTRRLGGVGNLLDEIRAAQQLATSQAQLEGALAGLTRAQEALGIAVGANAPLDARGEPDLAGGPASVDEGVTLAEQTRTDVALARERARAAQRVTRDSWADWLPTLSLNAQAYRQEPHNATTTPEHGWQAQLVLSLPLFEGGMRVGQLRERGALESEANLTLDGTLQQARSDVRTAYANLEHAVTGLDQNRRAAEQAHQALDLVTKAFQAGATTSLDVTDAERTARDADSAAVVAEDGVRQSRLDLLAATGRFPGS
jgi:outer membrane protein TolC